MPIGLQGLGFRNILFPVLVAGNTIRIDKSGLFIYSGPPAKGDLIAAAVPAAVTDLVGNQVLPVLTAGKWSASTGLPAGTSNVDVNGNLSVIGPDNVTRLQIFTGADGIAGHNPGQVRWLNDFGAVIQLIDPTLSCTVQYQDLGSATQGGVLGGQVASTSSIHEPVGGFLLNPGITVIDPTFGDNLRVFGDIVQFDQLGMTRQAFISSQDPAGATSAPYLSVESPEHTTALHAQTLLYGATQDGTTHPPKVLYGQKSGVGTDPLVKTSDYLEIQPVSGQNAIQAFMQAAADHALDTRVTGDTVDRISIGGATVISAGPGNAAQDINLVRGGVGQWQTTGSPAAGTFNLSVLPTGTGIGGIAVIMNQAADFAYASKVAGDTNPRITIAGNTIAFGSGAVATDATLSRSNSATLSVGNSLVVNNTLFLADVAAPGTPSGFSSMYSATGHVKYVSEDGNKYDTGILHKVISPVQTISSITFVNVTNASFAVAALQYRIRMKVWYTSSAAAGTPQFQITAPTNTSPSFMAEFLQGGNVVTIRAGTGSLTPGVGPTLPGAGTNAIADLEFDATFTSSGTVQLQALTSAVADTFVVQTIYMELYPEV